MRTARKTEIGGGEGRDRREGETRGARDDPNHVAIYLSRESGHYRVKFG